MIAFPTAWVAMAIGLSGVSLLGADCDGVEAAVLAVLAGFLPNTLQIKSVVIRTPSFLDRSKTFFHFFVCSSSVRSCNLYA